MNDFPIVLFRHGDVFTDVEPNSLLAHLRLDPASSPVDVTNGILVEVDAQDLSDAGLIFEPSSYSEEPREEFGAWGLDAPGEEGHGSQILSVGHVPNAFRIHG